MSLLFRTALALAVITAGAAFAQDHTATDGHAGHDHATSQPMQDHSAHEHMMGSQPASPSATQPTTAPTGSPETVGPVANTMCPVMNQPINEQFHTTYQGKTVYFCCGSCPNVFNSNPERYVSQLPQFSDSTN